MTLSRLDGKRVLLTQSNEFMGPALTEVFREMGAEVIADPRALDQDSDLPRTLVAASGRVDVLLVHLALPAPNTPAGEIGDAEWRNVFAHLVDPMPRLVSAVLPQMLERKSGRILLMGSAAALRGQKRTGSYSAARGAQLAYVQSAALELIQHGIQFNVIAQNFVANPPRYRPIHASRNGSCEKCRSAEWCPRKRMRSSPPTFAATPRPASSARCSRSAAVGRTAELRSRAAPWPCPEPAVSHWHLSIGDGRVHRVPAISRRSCPAACVQANTITITHLVL